MPSVGTASLDVDVDKGQVGRSISSAVNANRGTISGLGRSMGSHLSTGFASTMAVGKTVAKTTAVIGAGVIALGGLVAGTGLKVGNSLEKTELQFETLTGSADKAHKIVQDLFTFAKTTPFETGPVIEAARSLQTFGGAALNTQANLKLVGDAAAATSSELPDVAFWIGRAYSAIQAGRPFGEAAARLQELAILSPTARAEMEKLQEAGAKNSEVWAVLEKDLGKFNGAMGKQAGTWEGLTSTLSDVWSLSSQEVFEPFRGLLKDVTGDAIKLTESPMWDRWVGVAKNAVGDAVEQLQILRAAIKDVVTNEGEIPLDQLGGFAGLGEGVGRLADRLEADMPRLAGALEGFSGIFEGVDTSGGLGSTLMQMFDDIDPAQFAGRFTDFFVEVTANMDFGKFSESLTTFVINTLLNLDIARLVSAMVPLAMNLMDGFVAGIFKAATEHPVDFVLLLLALGFAPAKVIGAIGSTLAKIPIVGPFMAWILEGLAFLGGKLTGPIKKVLEPLGRGMLSGLKDGAAAAFEATVGKWFGGLGSRILGETGSLKDVLFKAGEALMGGLLRGIKAGFKAVGSFLGGIAGAARNLKGPEDHDKKVLHDPGLWLMEGLDRGLRAGFPAVEDTLGDANRLFDNFGRNRPTVPQLVPFGLPASAPVSSRFDDAVADGGFAEVLGAMNAGQVRPVVLVADGREIAQVVARGFKGRGDERG